MKNSDLRPADCYFLDFMERDRTGIMQYFSQLINIGRTHILFDREVFKTELFLNYNKTLGTFFGISVNPVYQSM